MSLFTDFGRSDPEFEKEMDRRLRQEIDEWSKSQRLIFHHRHEMAYEDLRSQLVYSRPRKIPQLKTDDD